MRIGIAAGVALVLAAICAWVLWPSKPTSSGRNSYQSGVSNQYQAQPSNQLPRVACPAGQGWSEEWNQCLEVVDMKEAACPGAVMNSDGDCRPCSEVLPGTLYAPSVGHCVPINSGGVNDPRPLGAAVPSTICPVGSDWDNAVKSCIYPQPGSVRGAPYPSRGDAAASKCNPGYTYADGWGTCETKLDARCDLNGTVFVDQVGKCLWAGKGQSPN
jgi:hypothetical protein